jgi:hypothetical protein
LGLRRATSFYALNRRLAVEAEIIPEHLFRALLFAATDEIPVPRKAT